eukprot:2637820-Rhodomonas_salina.1
MRMLLVLRVCEGLGGCDDDNVDGVDGVDDDDGPGDPTRIRAPSLSNSSMGRGRQRVRASTRQP